MISRCLVTSFALAALLGGAWALSYVQDELLWTKQQWNEFKLDFPYSVFKDEGNKLVDVRESPSPSFVDSTLRGPQTDLEHLIEEDIRRWVKIFYCISNHLVFHDLLVFSFFFVADFENRYQYA